MCGSSIVDMNRGVPNEVGGIGRSLNTYDVWNLL